LDTVAKVIGRPIEWTAVAANVVVAVCCSVATAWLLNPAAVVPVLFNMAGSALVEPILTAAATLAAAYYGAKYAFQLNTKHQDSKTEDADFKAGTQTFLALVFMLNRLLNIKHQAIDPFRNHPQRECEVVPVRIDDAGLAVDVNGLKFLIDDDIDFIGEVVAASWGYAAAIATIGDRTKIMEDQLAPMAAAYRNEHPNAPGFPMPPALRETLRVRTTHMIDIVDSEIERINRIANALAERLRRRFPSQRKLFNVAPIEVKASKAARLDWPRLDLGQPPATVTFTWTNL